jgi:TolB protein
MNADGSGVRQLTDNGGHVAPSTPRAQLPAPTSARDETPAFSPDGRLIAFTSNRDADDGGPAEVYVMPADGSRERRLTTDARYDFTPAFSSDGREIVFASCPETTPGCDLVAIAPDGGRIAYVRMHAQSHFQHMEIHVISADAGDDDQLTDDDTGDASPAWSPNGERIAFVSNRAESARCFTHDCVGFTTELYVMDADGGDVTRLTETPAEETSPAWSPDGERIVFARQASFQAATHLWVVNADGTCATRLGRGSAPAWYGPAGSRVGRLVC